MKKSHVLTAILLFSLTTSTIFAFTDVDSSHVNYDAITYVETEGIVNGYDDGSYQADKTINRAEFTKIIIEATMDIDTTDTSLGSLDLTDLTDGAWYVPYVKAAVEEGIIEGYPDKTFKPTDPINFVEASKIIVKGFEYDIDEDSETWYKPYVEELEDKNSIPTSINDFNSDVTRGEMAEIIYILLDSITNKDSSTYEDLGQEAQYIEYTDELYESLLGSEAFVLYFHAPWCALCQQIATYLEENLDSFPNDTIFLETDYDTEIDLKQEYEVTIQYTFVVFDKEGNVLHNLATNNMGYIRLAIEESLL